LFRELKYVVLQPVQNSEVLREYIYKKGYEIIDEELCIDENKYYEIIKIRYDEKTYDEDDVFFEISEKLYNEKHPEIKGFIKHKLEKYRKILGKIQDDTALAVGRKRELEMKLKRLEEMLEWL
ncbi:MAG TPA: tRNA (adenine(22)-N(1))-methyltransferase TrmK, partial [Clostridiaceae bacterium]